MHNPDNERIKRHYFSFLKHAQRHSEATVDAVAKSLSRFEEYAHWRDFRTFRCEQAVAFKNRLATQDGKSPGRKLSKATQHATLADLKRFFQWLSHQPTYKSRIRYTDAEYFNLSDKDARVATARRDARVPTMEQVLHVLARMPCGTEVERRNRALVAFVVLTGARDRAVASFKLAHIDLAAGTVYQDARDVQTKNSKTFTTYFFPVGNDFRGIVAEWVEYLRTERLWGNDDPLFPATAVRPDASRRFVVTGITRDHWKTAAPIRTVFRDAFVGAGLPYFNPHSFRHMLVQLGESMCVTAEEFKAWSQNLGHEGVLTTFRAYGHVATGRQRDIIRDLGSQKARDIPTNAEGFADQVARALRTQLSGLTQG
jgi:integrase